MGELDGRMVARLEGLFRVRGEMGSIHEVALIMLLRLRGSARPWGEEGMVRVEKKEDGYGMHIIRMGDIEGMAHVIPIDPGRLWLVNNRLDFSTWNELYA